jgi:hypothetical protein
MRNWKSDLRHAGGRMCLSCVLLPLAATLAQGGDGAHPSTASAPSSGLSVPLREIPVWELANERVRSSFLRGQYAYASPRDPRSSQDSRSPRTVYPQFTSDTPLFGEVSFQNAGSASRTSGCFKFALDCSHEGGDYDLLYFDDNGDADLTNDRPRKPAPQSDRLGRRSSSVKEVYFEPVTVTFNFRPAGRWALELLPCLRAYPGSTPQFSFVAARLHTGAFEIDGVSYEVFVGYQFMIQGSLDQPSTTLILAPQGDDPIYWWGGDQLSATHLFGGRYYRFSCTPAGDTLSVRPYDGPLGTFEVGAGGRKVRKVQVRGSLRSRDSAVAVGDGLEHGWPKATRQCRVPVGDYYPAMIDVEMGDLAVTVSNNYHRNAQGQSRGRESVAGIKIRAVEPYVLDFSNKPAVVFTEPVADRLVARGQEIMIKAVLLDPVLDIMVRRLNDTAHSKTETFKTPDGKEQTYTRPLSLDPKVTVTRSNGEIVAEGVMPFG